MIEEWDYEETLLFLEAWWGVTREGARRIHRVGRRMLAETVRGAEPRKRWPRRFARESDVETYPEGGSFRHVGRERAEGPELRGGEGR